MHDAVSVPHKAGAQVILFLGPFPPQRLTGQGGRRGQMLPLKGFDLFPYQHKHPPIRFILLTNYVIRANLHFFFFFPKNIFSGQQKSRPEAAFCFITIAPAPRLVP
jgi:hypothetical protein